MANPPGGSTTTVDLGGGYTGLDGVRYTSVTLAAANGITLLSSPCGDLNGDGVVNIGDALLAAQMDVGLRTCVARPDLCDVNQDGACNIGDALRLAQCDVGLIPCGFTCGPFTCPGVPGGLVRPGS